MIYGMDFLAGVRYPKLIIRNLPKGWALGIFAEIFGNAYKKIDNIVRQTMPPLVRVQLIWHDNHNFGDKDIKKVRQLSRKYNKMALKYPSVIFELSPFCEHNVSNPDKYLDIAQSEAPNCTIVNTPYKGALSKKYKNEVHGNHKAPNGRYNYSFDGLACVDADTQGFKNTHKNSEVFFFWTHQYNLRKNVHDRRTRAQRIKDPAKPTKKLVQSIAALAENKGNVSLNKSVLWKSHAEQGATKPNPRDGKPVILSKQKYNFIDLIMSNGKRLARIKYAGRFHDGRSVYRVSKWGFELSNQAVNQSGSPLLTLKGDNKVLGNVNPSFREGDWK